MWIKVENFDQDVKQGDLIKLDYPHNEFKVRHIGAKWLVLMQHNVLHSGIDSYECVELKKQTWQVWREMERWKPGHHEIYFYADERGYPIMSEWTGSVNLDQVRFDQGTVWRTKEQAQAFADECKKVAQMLHEKFQE